MTITANSGPLITFGTVIGSTGNTMEYNEDRAPSLNDLGSGFLDPRLPYAYQPGENSSAFMAVGFLNNMGLVDATPATKSSQVIATSSATAITAGTAIVLNTSLSSGGFTPNISIMAAETGRSVTVSAIDWSTAAVIGSCFGALLPFGAAGRVTVWNPQNALARTITLSPSTNSDGGNFTVAGRDLYGYKMTESFAGGSTTIKGVKAWKYITSVMPCTTIVSTGLGIGINDAFGFPWVMQPLANGYTTVWMNTSTNAYLIATGTSQSHVWGSTVATQTASTPDVRGLFFSTGSTNPISANSSFRVEIFQNLSPLQMLSIGSSGLGGVGLYGAAGSATNWSGVFGAVQFSSV